MVDKQEIWRDIYGELQGKDPVFKVNVSGLVLDYIESDNPAYLDRAFILCDIEGVTPPKHLIRYLAAVINKRLSGIQSPTQSQVSKVQKERDRNIAFLWAFKLIHGCGLVKSEAITRACAALDRELPDNNLKSSSFEKYYDAWVRENSWTDGLKEFFCEWTPENIKEFVAFFPDNLPDGLQGTRQ